MNVVQLRPNSQVVEDEQKEFFETLREQTEQLIYVCIDKEGNYSFGHTKLDPDKLALLQWQMNKVIDGLIMGYTLETNNA